MKKIILWFGTKLAFNVFMNDINFMSDNIEFRLITDDDQQKIQGIEISGYILHESANRRLKQFVRINEHYIKCRIR